MYISKHPYHPYMYIFLEGYPYKGLINTGVTLGSCRRLDLIDSRSSNPLKTKEHLFGTPCINKSILFEEKLAINKQVQIF